MDFATFSILLLDVGFLILIFKEINYYRLGWGLNFHLIDIGDQGSWVKPHPTKFERIWLLIAIFTKISLLIALLVPTYFSLYN